MSVNYTFTGSAGGLPSPWERVAGPAILELDGSGKGQLSSTGGQSHEAIYVGAVSTLAQEVEIEFDAVGSTAMFIWVMVRLSGVDGTRNYLSISGGDNDDNIYFTRVTNGSSVDFTSIDRGGSLQAGDRLKLRISGDGTNPTMTAFVNDVQVGSPQTYTGTLNQVGEIGVGMFCSTGGSSGPRMDNFIGGDVGGGSPYTLAADPGAVVIAGTDANLHPTNRTLDAAAGSVTIAGTAVSFHTVILGASGAFLITGTDANLIYDSPGEYVLVADIGAYSLSGTNAGLLFAKEIAAASGAFLITGQEIDLDWSEEPDEGGLINTAALTDILTII